MAAFFESIWSAVKGFFNFFQLNDLLDIVIVTFIIYTLLILLRDTRSQQLIKVVIGFAIVYAIAQYLRLSILLIILQSIAPVGLIMLVVLFQPELRRAIEQIGRKRFKNLGSSLFGHSSETMDIANTVKRSIKSVCDSMVILQRQRMGALIVFEREINLDEILDTGTFVDAYPSTELICNIFYNKAPLHDGALIIRNGKIQGAACILPLSSNSEISSELGTRHRAGLGMSESSDAVIAIVSEETGAFSIAQNGELKRNLAIHDVRQLLEEAFADRISEDPQNGLISSLWRKNK
ncbi:MAG: diadenylate cyclase CdaA [Clostridia bacterium]|nr:diadenylate cyclase CdaA [Clostridia bacterium]